MSTSAAPEEEAGITRQPGDAFWSQGDVNVQPLLVKEGVVAYCVGEVAIGLIGPGQVAMPVPGVNSSGPALAGLRAVTESVCEPVAQVSAADLLTSAKSIVTGADRLGNMSLPQRLAALLLDITEMTGQPVVGCRQDILAMTAAARRETVATILSSWRDEDWIQTRYRRCKVIDRDALIRIRDRDTADDAIMYA